MSEKMKEYHSYNNACKGLCICVNIININPVVSFQSEPGSKVLASSESRICLPAKQAGLAFAGEVFHKRLLSLEGSAYSREMVKADKSVSSRWLCGDYAQGKYWVNNWIKPIGGVLWVSTWSY